MPCSCEQPAVEPDPFGEAYAASVLTAVREPNRAARRAAREGHRAKRALQAAAAMPFEAAFPVPLYPPRDWFAGPPDWVAPWRAAAGLTPADEGGILRLTITDDGRIGGWFYNAGQCLVHDPTACPGASPTRYAAFHQSDVLCGDGQMVDCGVIGMTHGHQSPWLDWKEAQRLYADPTAQKILCVAGDDERGGWIAGCVVPGTTYGDVALMRRSGLSGDWRPMPQAWWATHGITAAAVRQAEGYDCIGPTLVTRPALPLVRNFSVDGRAAAILGGAAGIEFDVSRFSRIDRERIVIAASFEPRDGVSRFARRAYTAENFNEADVVREHGRFARKDGGAVEIVPGEKPRAVPVEPSTMLHSKAAPGEHDTVLADLRTEAADVMDKAAAADKLVTPALQSIVTQIDQGTELVGLGERLKSNEDRIAEKLAEAHAEGLDDAAAKATIGDALRYTVAQDPNQYTMTYTQTRSGLIAAGFTPVPDKEKNYWEEGDAYQGFNTNWMTPDGTQFEVQFHTPDSWRVKNEIHDTFKEYRSTDDRAAKQQLSDEMARKWDGIEIPEGILDHGHLMLSDQPAASRQAALDKPIRYFRTDQGKVFRERSEDGGHYMEYRAPDGTWVVDDDLMLYLIGQDNGYMPIPDPTQPQQGSVSRFARRAYFDESKHPRDKGRFTFKPVEDTYGGVMPRTGRKLLETPQQHAARRKEGLINQLGTHERFDFGVGDTGPISRVEAVALPNRVLQYPEDVQALVDANPQMSGEDNFAYQGRIVEMLDPQTQADVIYAMRETYEPVPYIADGMNQWVSDRGLNPLPADLVKVPVDVEEAYSLGRYFESTQDQSTDPAVRAAYDDFKQQNNAMYDYMTKPTDQGGLGITVDYTDQHDPYPTARAQAEDLEFNHHITVESGLGGNHPLLTTPEYDQFRAVHDVFGHAGVGGGFDRHGEYEAWLAHAGMYTDPGRQAMSTEYHGVNSAAVSGNPNDPGEGTGKAMLLPEPYGTPPWERDQQPAAVAAAVSPAPDPQAVVDELIRVLGLDESFGQKFDHPAWHFDTPDAAQASVSRFARRAYTWDPEAHPRDVGGKFLGIGGNPTERRDAARQETNDLLKKMGGAPIELRTDIADKDLGRIRGELKTSTTPEDYRLIRDFIESKGLNRLTNPEPKQRRPEQSLRVPVRVGPGGLHPALGSVSRFSRRGYTKENFDESLVHRDHGMFSTGDGGGDATTTTDGGALADKFIKGEKISLPPDEVATFTDTLGKWIKSEQDAGRTGVLNMCEVSVPGTNLFCGESQGIPRQRMPQLTGPPVPGSPADSLPHDKDGSVNISNGFRDYLRDTLGAKLSNDVVPSASLKATQNELRSDKTSGIAEGIRSGKVNLEGGDRIFVSSDNYILDGHHRWAGAILNDLEDGHLGDAKMPIERVDMGILDLVKVANQYATDQGVAQKGLGPEGNPLSGIQQASIGARLAATKHEAGADFRAGDYAYVPDSTKPSTWKLRLTTSPGGAPDAGMVGRAVAALGKGYRGNKVQLPAADRDKVRARLRGAWKRANPDKTEADMPAVLKDARAAAAADPVAALRALAQEFAIGQHRFHVKPGPVMSALYSAAAFLDRQEPAKAAPKLDAAVKIVEELEKAQPVALKGMTDRVKAIRDGVAGGAKKAPAPAAKKPGSNLPPWLAATVPTSQEVAMDTETIDTRYIIMFPDGTRADSASIGVRVASLPIVASVVAAGDLPVAPPDTPWDEATAKANLLSAAGNNMDEYAKAFLFHDDTQQGPDSYYWPIADVIGGTVTVVPAAVDAAMAAVNDGTIGTLTPDEKAATAAILQAYAPQPQDQAAQDQAMQAEVKSLRARVNAFDEFMNDYLQAKIASIVDTELPLPTVEEPEPEPVSA